MDTIPSNLPLPLSSFIGRKREIAEVESLLTSARLVTLTGAGGCGKTWLALQVAAECCRSSSANYSYADGVWLVEFAPLSDPALVPQRLVSMLDVPEQPGQPLLTTLTNFLRDMHTLLLLDNCEHLIAACAQLAETLLQRCAHVRILATSREALRVTGEMIFLVPSLAAPDPSRLASLETLGQYEAVRLFAERARAGQPTFALTQENMASVAQICHRLDGMPLALELAAARVRASSAKQIAERLDHACQLLTGGSRTALPRHQTLRAAIGWSYDLLPEAERVLCRRLSVFAGGWTLEAAAAVCGGPDIEAAEALDLLEKLVSKSLVLVDHAGNGVRYRMLETIRQYSGEKLQESGEADQVRRRHLGFCVNCAEQAEPMLGSAQRAEWLSRLRVEHDNLRAALGWACTCEPEAACWLAGLLRWFWHMNERDDEAHAWYGRVLGLARQRTPTRGLALALLGAGMISGILLDLEEAQGLLEQSMGLWQVLDDRARLAETLHHLGRARVMLGHAEDACVMFESHAALIRQYADPMILANILTWWGRALVTTRRDYAGAMALHEQSLSIGRSIEDPITLGLTYRYMGFCAIEQADYEAAERFNQEALTWRRRASTRLIALSLLHSADVACLRGNYPQAQALYNEALATCRALGIQGWVAHVLARLGYLALHQGDTAGAVTHLSEAIKLCRERGDRAGIARCLAGCAELRRQQGHIEQCVRLLASDALAPVLQDVRGPVDRIEYERTAAAARAQLDEAALARAWTEGRALTLEQAVASAGTDLMLLAASVTPSPAAASAEVERPASPALRIWGLGAARVYRGSQMLTAADWTYAKAKELLFYLLCYSPVTKGAVGLALWPDISPARLRNIFGVTMYHARRALGDADWITLDGELYAFNRSRDYVFDVEAFESNLAQAQKLLRLQQPEYPQALLNLRKAVNLYQGDFLQDVIDSDWCLPRREELRRKQLEALLTLGRLLFSDKQYAEAVHVYERAISQDSYLEVAHRELMRCYVRQGERAQALRHYRSLLGLMRDELGAPPAAETTSLFDRIRHGDEI